MIRRVGLREPRPRDDFVHGERAVQQRAQDGETRRVSQAVKEFGFQSNQLGIGGK